MQTLNCNFQPHFKSNFPCECSDLDDRSAADESSFTWTNGSEHSLMLFHPGSKPQRPIAPITLLTLAISTSKSTDPSTEQQQSPLGGSQPLVGLGTTPYPSVAHLSGLAHVNPVQPSQNQENLPGKLAGEPPNPDGSPGDGHANPSRGKEHAYPRAAAETLTVLLWVHPAAAREAWETLKVTAQGLDIGCFSRSAHAPPPPLCRIHNHGTRYTVVTYQS